MTLTTNCKEKTVGGPPKLKRVECLYTKENPK